MYIDLYKLVDSNILQIFFVTSFSAGAAGVILSHIGDEAVISKRTGHLRILTELTDGKIKTCHPTILGNSITCSEALTVKSN